VAFIAEQVWQWLEDVPDPEIPVISIVDLGIVRDVRLDEGDECVVTITPTYSGCPAMLVISEAIADTLGRNGVARFRLETQLSPAWTTDWMSESGKQRLKEYGIAPPLRTSGEHQAIDISGLIRRKTAEPALQCPRCGSAHTRMSSQFGSTACKALYVCNDCHEPFDYFKCH
jgi:ring-1,2-phenylacetyl-CoA epoxidase subunit PaaD